MLAKIQWIISLHSVEFNWEKFENFQILFFNQVGNSYDSLVTIDFSEMWLFILLKYLV